ncbi:Na/Pi cotransporter family protein [Roseinatronobacter sp.]|uniref:Na/Pi cotransporter family protein n=1 Tax=Roseinatronobacter sp. TaxID=1945755 RepID=UPI003F723B6A
METSPILFILNMAGAAALLIWAVRLVRTGFERAFGGQLRLWLRRSTSNRFAAAASGAGAAVLLQSSTAVAMLMAGFVSAGAIGSLAGMAIVLGADLGSAVVALILNSRLVGVTPILLLGGVLIFLRSSRRRLRQIGRIMIGLALVFLSLDLIREASLPLVDSAGARGVMLYLANDPISAFLLAAAFAWLVHSSVAAVLLFATLAAQGALPPVAAFAMVLGANLGGAMIAFLLTLKSDVAVRRVIWANLVLRGGGAVLVLWAIVAGQIPVHLLGADAGAQALHLHLLFNAVLLAVCLPLVGPITRMTALLVQEAPNPNAAELHSSSLDPAVQDQPARAYACAVRELVDMGSRIETMMRQVLPLFENFDDVSAQKLQDALDRVERRSLEVRMYLAKVRNREGEEDIGTRAFELSATAINLEAGADMIARKAVELARRKSLESLNFSEDGWRELADFHDIVLRNVQQGIAVLMSEDVGLARELVEEKEKVRNIARDLQSRHLERLRQGLTESIETSAIHLELLRAFKSLNTSFAMIGYPLLSKRGELLDSRLTGA